jgi:hypothetical protein
MTPLRRKMIEELQIRPRAVSRQRNSLRRMVRFAQHYRRWAHFETIGIPPARRSREANESPLTPTTTCGTPATQTKRHFTVIFESIQSSDRQTTGRFCTLFSPPACPRHTPWQCHVIVGEILSGFGPIGRLGA